MMALERDKYNTCSYFVFVSGQLSSLSLSLTVVCNQQVYIYLLLFLFKATSVTLGNPKPKQQIQNINEQLIKQSRLLTVHFDCFESFCLMANNQRFIGIYALFSVGTGAAFIAGIVFILEKTDQTKHYNSQVLQNCKLNYEVNMLNSTHFLVKYYQHSIFISFKL